jgi:hypothetical protein
MASKHPLSPDAAPLQGPRLFCEETWQEQLDRSEAKWRKKRDQLRAAA